MDRRPDRASIWCSSRSSTSRSRSGRSPACSPGTVGGLAQDALAGGIVGIGGLAKTIVGFFVGVLGAQFIVSQPLPRFVMFVGATFAHELLFQGLYALIESRAFTVQYSALLIQALVNALSACSRSR